MLRLTLHPVELPLRHAWTIAHGTRTVQRNLIVALHDEHTGHVGYGEAPGIPYMGVNPEAVAELLRPFNGPWFIDDDTDVAPYELAGFVHDGWNSMDQDGVMTRGLRPAFGQTLDTPAFRFACCALDQAMYDLYGKNRGLPLNQHWRLDPAVVPTSSYTLGLAAPEVMADKLAEFPDFPYYKIKLGTGDPRNDLGIVEHLRRHTDRPFRVDANTAWTAEETIRLSGPLRDLGVEFIEQPLKPALPRSEHEAVFFGSDLPVIADESCQTEEDVEKCAGLFHGVNIKLCKCGGMTPARRMIAKARELDLRVMMGCMTETTVGISALAQFLPLLDYVDMDGALLLAPGSDPAEGVRLGNDGVAAFPEGDAAHGNGVRLKRELPELA
ncbi:MAG: dipeptide epimerase [Planctomycetota bacterium]